MEINLSLIGMEKGRQYETVITSKNCDNTFNAAPIGAICSGPDTVVHRIFKGSHTLENIISQREYYVNITHNPEIFTASTIGNLPQDYFTPDGKLKCADAYFKCEVISLKEAVKKSDPIKKDGKAIVIKSKVVELVIINETKAFNRGLGYVIECLTNISRVDLVDDDKKQEYFKRFGEANRIVTKIGSKEDITSMKKIKEVLMEKGYEP